MDRRRLPTSASTEFTKPNPVSNTNSNPNPNNANNIPSTVNGAMVNSIGKPSRGRPRAVVVPSSRATTITSGSLSTSPSMEVIKPPLPLPLSHTSSTPLSVVVDYGSTPQAQQQNGKSNPPSMIAGGDMAALLAAIHGVTNTYSGMGKEYGDEKRSNNIIINGEEKTLGGEREVVRSNRRRRGGSHDNNDSDANTNPPPSITSNGVVPISSKDSFVRPMLGSLPPPQSLRSLGIVDHDDDDDED